MRNKILIIDDEYDICNMVSMVLGEYDVKKAFCIDGAEEILKNNKIDLLILDVWLGTGNTGLEFLKKFREVSNIPVIVISGHGSVDLAIKAIKLGAEDFLEKPFSGDKLTILVERLLKSHNQIHKSKLIPVPEYFFVGESPKWVSLHKKLEGTNSKKIILSGGPGTGKSEAAALIIKNLPIVKNILYFFDSDINKIPTLKTNDVVILSLNDPSMIKNIHGICNIIIKVGKIKMGIEIPSLMNRNNDIEYLFEYFLIQISKRLLINIQHEVESEDFYKYSWPGNVLELQSLVTQLAIEALDTGIITRNMFLNKINAIDLYSYDIKKAKNVFEKQYLSVNLQRCNKNIAKMARIIGMERSALYRKMKKDNSETN